MGLSNKISMVFPFPVKVPHHVQSSAEIPQVGPPVIEIPSLSKSFPALLKGDPLHAVGPDAMVNETGLLQLL